MRTLLLMSSLATLFGPGAAAAQAMTVGPFTVEAVERKISAGGFPNTSSNPFKRTTVTTYRVLHKGQPVLPPGLPPDHAAPWWEARVLSDAPQPALLLMQLGAVLVTDAGGQLQVRELAPAKGARTEWQWLDGLQGQPAATTVVAIADRSGEPRELSGGRWLSVYGQAILDVKTLGVHRYTLNSTPVLDPLQQYYAAGRPMLAFSPGGTQFVVAGERDRPGEADLSKRHEHALIAFDFVGQRGTVLPIDLTAWRLQGPQDINAAWARKAVAWRRGPDGREQAYLRQDLPLSWLGKLTGREMQALAFELQPVLPTMRDVMVQFLQSEFKATVTPGPSGQGMEARIGELALSLGFLRPQEQRLSLYYAGNFQLKAQADVLIERIAERFNARLAKGEHQQQFVGTAAASLKR